MLKELRRATLALVLAAVAVQTACDRPGPSELVKDPVLEPQAGKVVGLDGHHYKLLKGQLSGVSGSTSKWIGPEGGVVSISGLAKNGLPTQHALVIPPGAVATRTKFTLRIASHKVLKVTLKAEQRSLLTGHLVDVGGAGFAVPVTLTLSTAWATNMANPAAIVVLRDPENGGPFVPVPSVATGGSLIVTALLNHFSKYAAAEN